MGAPFHPLLLNLSQPLARLTNQSIIYHRCIGTRARVRFVDYGHCDSVSLSHVRCVLNSLPDDAAYAIGPLSLVPPEAEEKSDAVAKLQSIVDDQTQFSFGKYDSRQPLVVTKNKGRVAYDSD